MDRGWGDEPGRGDPDEPRPERDRERELYGIVAAIPPLDGLGRAEADRVLRGYEPVRVAATRGGYTEYRFGDSSEVQIRPDGEVIRIPRRRYDPTGRRVDKHHRYDPYAGRSIGEDPERHQIGERLGDGGNDDGR